MLSTRNKARFMSVLVILAMLFSFASVSPAAAQDACTSSGLPTVSTNQPDYGAYDTVLITGSGFGCGQVFSVLVTAPDGSTLSGSGVGASGPDSVTTDANGEFVLNYALYGSFPDGNTYVGQEGIYTIDVMDGAIIMASTTFTDSHFRYFTIGWTRNTGTRDLSFQATSGWRASPSVRLLYGDGGAQFLPNTLIASGSDATGSFEIYKHSAVHTYPSDGLFVASFTNCCRISSLSNAANAFWNEQITIDLRGNNNGGPASGLPPVVQMAQNQANSIVIPTGDPDGDLVSCRMSTSSESSIPSLPAGLSVSSNCVLSWTPSVGVNSLWAVQVMLESTHGGFVSRTPLDFMIQIINGRPPVCVLNGATNNTVTVGSPFSIGMTGNDPDNQNLTISHLGIPTGATLTPASGTNQPSPFAANFNWTPGSADAGTSTSVSIVYTDPNGLSALCSFSVTVPRNSPPTVSAGGPYSGDEGSAIAMSGATASDPDIADTLTYTWTSYSGLCTFSNANDLNPNLSCSDNGNFTVALEVSDGTETVVSDTSVTVSNVAPTAVFGNNGPLNEGSDISLSLTSPFDPSSDDTTAGFQYAFDCGSGYGALSTTSTAACSTADNGTRAVKGKIQDKDGGFTEYTANVTIDNVAPTIAISGASNVNEGSLYSVTLGAATDPGTDTVTDYIVNWGDGNTDSYSSNGVQTHTYVDGPINYNITVDLTDEDGTFLDRANALSVTVDNVAPTLGAISVDQALVPVGTSINASANFTDPGTLDTHTATWDWGDGTTSAGTVSEAGGNGTASDSHSYSTPGVYTLRLTVTDKDGAVSNESVYEYVVVFDPNGGFVTGGGWINSPAGAYAADPSLTGKASFGFVAKYKKGQSTPDGNTEFQFKAGNLNFHSSSYQWLVVAGSKAQFKGEGTINGDGHYGFMLTARDGTPDQFRIKIWDMNNGDTIVYDNLMSGADDADPTTALGGGSIVIHK